MTELKFVVNQTTAKAERREHDGREFLVAPTVAIVEGVMNGLLYTEEEMARYIEVWNGKPLPLSHPKDQAGNDISANSPDQHAQSLGFFFNAKFDNAKLKGEWWIDLGKAEKLGVQANEVVRRLEAGEMVEQSTGLYLDVEPTEGVFNDQAYVGIARNIRPDHVAILLNEPGACSIEDGCGTPRVNADQNNGNIATKMITKIESLFNNLMESITMKDKEKLVNTLVANEACPFDAEYLQNAPIEQLEKLEALMETNEPDPEPEPVVSGDEGDGDEGEPKTEIELPENVTALAGLVEELGGVAALKETLSGIKANSDTQREGWITEITANTKFTADELGSMTDGQLKKLAETTKPQPTGNYFRPAPTANNDADGEWEAYKMPESALNGSGK